MMVGFFRDTLLVNLLSFEGKEESTFNFHEKRATQTLSSSVNITTLGTESIRVFSVFFFFLAFTSVRRRTDCSTAVNLPNC